MWGCIQLHHVDGPLAPCKRGVCTKIAGFCTMTTLIARRHIRACQSKQMQARSNAPTTGSGTPQTKVLGSPPKTAVLRKGRAMAKSSPPCEMLRQIVDADTETLSFGLGWPVIVSPSVRGIIAVVSAGVIATLTLLSSSLCCSASFIHYHSAPINTSSRHLQE